MRPPHETSWAGSRPGCKHSRRRPHREAAGLLWLPSEGGCCKLTTKIKPRKDYTKAPRSRKERDKTVKLFMRLATDANQAGIAYADSKYLRVDRNLDQLARTATKLRKVVRRER